MLSRMMFAAAPVEAWLEFVGTLHPALVHFPIALGIVAAIVEIWRAIRREPDLSPFALTAIWFAAVIAVFAATSGWYSAQFEGKDLTLSLFLHRWIGIGSAALLLILAVSGSFIRTRATSSRTGTWRMGLLAAAGAIGFVGHLGGTMVYGDGYITDALWNAIEQTELAQREGAALRAKAELGIVESTKEAPQAIVAAQTDPVGVVQIDFAKQILPILEARCYACHGRGKGKGGVRLDDLKRSTTERKGEWVVKPGDPSQSLMMRNIQLPADDENAMPPEGDRVPSAEIELIRQWIEQGARGEEGVSPGAVSDHRWSLPERLLTAEELARIRAATEVLSRLEVRVAPLAQGSPYFEADASGALPPIGDGQLVAFAALADFLVTLNLAHSAVSDSIGGSLVQLRSLRALRLDHTAAGDQVAANLAKMPHLESINFVATPLTDTGLSALVQLKSLRNLYVWSSQTTSGGVSAFRVARPDVKLIDGRE